MTATSYATTATPTKIPPGVDSVALEYLDDIPYACGPFADLSRCLIRHKDLQKPTCVAVKKWRVYSHQTTVNESSQFAGRLHARLAIYSRLSHARIVPLVHLVDTPNQVPLLVMPYYRHGNALDYITNSPSASVIKLQLDVVRGLEYMHSLNPPVAHGTLKASNIMITDSGNACIADACLNMLPMPPSWTIENAVYARWLAPEILSSGAGLDSTPLASLPGDVYSFAMTSIEMFTGHRPFSHIRSKVAVVLRALQGERPLRPSQVDAPQLSDTAWSVLRHCWKEDPASRPSISIVGKWLQLIAEQRHSNTHSGLLPSHPLPLEEKCATV